MIYATSKHEQELWKQGYQCVVGIDEVGRGCWAGPAVIGAVIFTPYFEPAYLLADSKKLTGEKRKELVPLIQNTAKGYAIVEVRLGEINQYGINNAIQNGFKQIIDTIKPKPDFILVDGFIINGVEKEKQQAIIRGDEQSISIAAASIIAKEYRDKIMREIHQKDPRFGFNTNVGYGTAQHRLAIKKHGLSQYHRTKYDLNKWLTIK